MASEQMATEAAPAVVDAKTKDQEDSLVFKMKLSEQAERYKDMVAYAKELVQLKPDPNDEQRNLISVAYKNVIGHRRAACRSLQAYEQKFESEGNASSKKLSSEYRCKIEVEVEDICKDIILLLDDHLLSSASDDEGRVFFYKMKGDYYRYLCEFKDEEGRKAIADKSEEAYMEASKNAQDLKPTNPIKLGLALNFSVFYYEIRNAPDKACEWAKKAFDAAINSLDGLTEDSYKDTTLIVQLLRDNLTLWSSDIDEEMENEESGQQQSSDTKPAAE